MSRSTLRRTITSFLVLLLSLTALAAAAPARPVAGPAAQVVKSPSILSFLWNRLIHLWEKEGSSLDPSGKPQATNTRRDEGSSLDPDGLLNDAGGSLDPDGAK
ncbi:MAG: hypothetical protein WAM82_36890 [Thermoanaerobaculia bacterium]